MSSVKIGVVGVGSMGANHVRSIINGSVPGAEVTALCDAFADLETQFPGIAAFREPEAFFASQAMDAVLIATPHYAHTSLGIQALGAGYHVLVEKPISVHKLDCERLLAVPRAPGQVFSAMFNQRTDPLYQTLRRLISNGELGDLVRVTWTITDWFRSNAYFRRGAWRATWAGEGGGVLINQCPHQLDLWQWLFGMPQRVRAFCSFGKYHPIEVEDEVTAYLEYDNGMTGVFITSTGESPGTNRLEIAGDRGKIVVENGEISFRRNEQGTAEYSRTTKNAFAGPLTWDVRVPVSSDRGDQHGKIIRNFVDAIQTGAPLLAPAEEGIHSVELGNAMLLSSFLDQTIELPMDGAVYETELKRRCESGGKSGE